MPRSNPKIINLAVMETEGDGFLCAECAMRLDIIDSLEEVAEYGFVDRDEQWHTEMGTTCQECRAFANGTHPELHRGMVSRQAVEAQIEYYRDNVPDDIPEAERRAKINILEWVLGEGRHTSG